MWCVTSVLVGGHHSHLWWSRSMVFWVHTYIKTEATLEQLVCVYSQVIPLSKPECVNQRIESRIAENLFGLRENCVKGFGLLLPSALAEEWRGIWVDNSEMCIFSCKILFCYQSWNFLLLSIVGHRRFAQPRLCLIFANLLSLALLISLFLRLFQQFGCTKFIHSLISCQ